MNRGFGLKYARLSNILDMDSLLHANVLKSWKNISISYSTSILVKYSNCNGISLSEGNRGR